MEWKQSNTSRVEEIQRLYDEYKKLSRKSMLGFLHRKTDYEPLQKQANDIYARVRAIRASLENNQSNLRSLAFYPPFVDFIKYFDLASGCLWSYLRYRSEYSKGLAPSRAELTAAEKEHRHFNRLLVKAEKKL